MLYMIWEGIFEDVEKKINRIKNKCKKYNCDFNYSIIGDEIRDVEDDEHFMHKVRYILVDVSGTAIAEDGWRFVGIIEHTTNGNILRINDTTLQVPKKYYNIDPICEHCNTNRRRKETCLIYNEPTGDWKQVGKSCLAEYTHGLDAELIARFASYYNVFEEASNHHVSNADKSEYYVNVKDFLNISFDVIRHFGYRKTYLDGEYNYDSTRNICSEIYAYLHGANTSDYFKELVKNHGVGLANSDAIINTENAIHWIMDQDDDNEYIHNLKVIVSNEYTSYKNLGILASLHQSYSNYMEKEMRNKTQHIEITNEYVREVGSKLEHVKVNSFKLVSMFDNMYGTTYLYSFIDTEGHAYIWYASKYIQNPEKVIAVSGKVKDHSEYRGIKQTVLTRCRCETT